jgi:hypothetical protein
MLQKKNKRNLILYIYQEKETKRKQASYRSSVIADDQEEPT